MTSLCDLADILGFRKFIVVGLRIIMLKSLNGYAYTPPVPSLSFARSGQDLDNDRLQPHLKKLYFKINFIFKFLLTHCILNYFPKKCLTCFLHIHSIYSEKF